MSIKSIQPRTATLILLIILPAAFRLLQSSPIFSFMSNVTPIGAVALFGGCYFHDKWKAYLIPLVTIWLSDIMINRIYYFDHWVFYYSGAYWIYGSFALMVLVGQMIKKVNVVNVALGGIAGALLHYIVSDFGVWFGSTYYTQDWNGFLQCYVLALPFLRNMLIGNLVFCTILFGIFEWAQRKYPVLQPQVS